MVFRVLLFPVPAKTTALLIFPTLIFSRYPMLQPATGDKPGGEPEDEPGDKPGDEPEDKPGDKPGDEPGDEPEDSPGSFARKPFLCSERRGVDDPVAVHFPGVNAVRSDYAVASFFSLTRGVTVNFR